jgi:hypothetical protein
LLNFFLRSGVHTDSRGVLQPWFFGVVERAEALEMLASQPPGTFIVRLYPRVQAYALSLRFASRVRHYKVVHTDKVHWGCWWLLIRILIPMDNEGSVRRCWLSWRI